ncbi:MAG: hypothetical protein JSV91_09155 [Phycisphaerales bacterium]|nr:MAG: hypothetical protein JSV91_09155 [Phycisphaerales bacterium]
MSEPRSSAGLAGPGMMLLSAVIFGYFGFTTSFVHTSAITGQLLIYVPMLEWTLKVTAILFAISGVAAFLRPLEANLLFCVAGLFSALLFVAVAVMDFADKQHMVMSPVLLLIFAAWNGFGSWSGLKAVIALRPVHDSDERTIGAP